MGEYFKNDVAIQYMFVPFVRDVYRNVVVVSAKYGYKMFIVIS